MRNFSTCCNADIHHQNGARFCTNCIRILSDSEIRVNIRPFIIILSLLVFVYVVFNTTKADAPAMQSFVRFHYPEVKPTTYAIDVMQIKIIEGNDNEAVSVAGAVGNMQIMPVTLEDWNNQHPNQQYTMEDMKNEVLNVKVGKWMLEKRIPEILTSSKIPLTINNILIAYNWGCGKLIDWYKNGAVIARLPDETQQYICKYWAKAKI